MTDATTETKLDRARGLLNAAKDRAGFPSTEWTALDEIDNIVLDALQEYLDSKSETHDALTEAARTYATLQDRCAPGSVDWLWYGEQEAECLRLAGDL
jgi:hypothetical protein